MRGRRTCASSSAPSLDAQPPPGEKDVSRISDMSHLLPRLFRPDNSAQGRSLARCRANLAGVSRLVWRPAGAAIPTGILAGMSTPETWLTPAAYRKLQEEYGMLTTEGRTHIAARLAEARSHGDIRENADYDAAKTEQGLMEARIRKLRHLLDHSTVGEAASDGTVQIGSVVTLMDEDGFEDDYLVAIPENRVPGFLLASPEGPLGTALVGAVAGDDVTYEAPGGMFKVTVLAVRPYDG